jgi:flagellar hook protein FlgE
MFRSLNTGVSGLQQFQQRIDVIGNNIANVGTTGYKGVRATNSDTFSDTLGNAVQVGRGVTAGGISSVFTQGGLMQTNVPADLAISGQGFFTVKDTATGITYATRDGSFTKTTDGYLVTSGGLRLQGFSDAGLTTRGDVKLDATGAVGALAGAQVSTFTIDEQGKVTVVLNDGSPAFVRGQVLLQNFTTPQSLVKEGSNLYSNLANSGPLAQTTAPGSAGLGTVESGQLEMSNVDLAGEFSNLIIAQRGFQANSRIITTSDELLQEIINLKR